MRHKIRISSLFVVVFCFPSHSHSAGIEARKALFRKQKTINKKSDAIKTAFCRSMYKLILRNTLGRSLKNQRRKHAD
jgi:hypothetical protein